MEETDARRLDLRLAVAAVSLLVVLAVPVVAFTGLIAEDSISGLPPAPKPHAVLGVARAEVPPFGPRLVHVVAHEAEPNHMLKLHALGLTEAQQDRIFEIFHQQASAMHEQLKQARRAGEELRKLAMADRFDEGRARQIADAQAKALAALAVIRAQTLSDLRRILTPEQRARMDQFADDRGPGLGYGVGVKN